MTVRPGTPSLILALALDGGTHWSGRVMAKATGWHATTITPSGAPARSFPRRTDTVICTRPELPTLSMQLTGDSRVLASLF
jgi:hypothetical protein